MNNKLDAFNNDKFRCPKCKEYFDFYAWMNKLLCDVCYEKWPQFVLDSEIRDVDDVWDDFINEQQT